MSTDKSETLLSLSDFCTASMDWCAKESETSITKINDILNLIVEDSERVSAVSMDTIAAIDNIKQIVNNLSSDGNREAANDLATALTESSREDMQIKKFVTPIMESLQFQDRISQNMKNFAKMIRVWIELRNDIEKGKEFTDQEKIDFGEKLLKCTTMSSERELVRKFIDNLSPEKDVGASALFF